MKRFAWIAVVAVGMGLGIWALFIRDVNPQIPISAQAPNGVGALQQLLHDYGFDVQATSTLSDPGEGTLLVIARTTGVSNAELIEFAGQGGDVILVGRQSGFPIGDRELVAGSPGVRDQGPCGIPALRGTTRISSSDEAVDLVIDGSQQVCFVEDGVARVVQESVEQGSITWIGDIGLIHNENIAKEQNAELFIRLLEGSDTVIFADARLTSPIEQASPPPQDSDSSEGPELFDLLPRWARLGLWQAMLAVVLFIWWRSRRLGDPVIEDLPVEVPASEFVRASGRLFQRSGARNMSLAYMRRSFREDCGRFVGLTADAPADLWVNTIASQTDRDAWNVRYLLYQAKPANENDLVRYTSQLDALREECMQ